MEIRASTMVRILGLTVKRLICVCDAKELERVKKDYSSRDSIILDLFTEVLQEQVV